MSSGGLKIVKNARDSIYEAVKVRYEGKEVSRLEGPKEVEEKLV